MSLHFLLMRISPNLNSIDDINENNILEIGSRIKLIDTISEIYPKLSFHEGYYYFPGCYEQNNTNSCWKLFLEDDDPVRCFIVSPHIGQCDLKVIESLCDRINCRIFDPQKSQFIY